MTYNSSLHSETGISLSEYLLKKSYAMVNKAIIILTEATDFWREGNPSFKPYCIGPKVLHKVVFSRNLLTHKLSDRCKEPYL